MIYTAAEIRSKIEAGLLMWGVDEDGEIEWVGTADKWRLAKYYEEVYLELL